MAFLHFPVVGTRQEEYNRDRRRDSLYLYTLKSNGLFSHKKADRELGYHTRDIGDTLRDTLEWLVEQGRIPQKELDGRQ